MVAHREAQSGDCSMGVCAERTPHIQQRVYIRREELMLTLCLYSAHSFSKNDREEKELLFFSFAELWPSGYYK